MVKAYHYNNDDSYLAEQFLQQVVLFTNLLFSGSSLLVRVHHFIGNRQVYFDTFITACHNPLHMVAKR